MKQRSKFYGIVFPFFGLKTIPYSYTFTTNSIKIKIHEQSKEAIVDLFNIHEPLSIRYAKNKEEEFEFDYTCTKTSHIINKKIKWGIDSTCRVYDLSKKQIFKARCVPITRIKQNLIWVDTITYPFTINKAIIDSKNLSELYVVVVYIDEVWVLHRFVDFYEPISEIKL
jgi:hypothetical protein